LLERLEQAFRLTRFPETAHRGREISGGLKRGSRARRLPSGQVKARGARVIAASLVQLGRAIDLAGGRSVICGLHQLSGRFELLRRSLGLVARRVVLRAKSVCQGSLTRPLQGTCRRPEVALKIGFNRRCAARKYEPLPSRQLHRQTDGTPRINDDLSFDDKVGATDQKLVLSTRE
jgi:hypothetical protein